MDIYICNSMKKLLKQLKMLTCYICCLVFVNLLTKTLPPPLMRLSYGSVTVINIRLVRLSPQV